MLLKRTENSDNEPFGGVEIDSTQSTVHGLRGVYTVFVCVAKNEPAHTRGEQMTKRNHKNG